MALAVCLLPDPRGERAVRALWDRLEAVGIGTLRSHTHGRHRPHLSYAVLRSWDRAAVYDAVTALPAGELVELELHGVATFRRGRAWLVPAVTSDLVARQEAVVQAVRKTGADLHLHYTPGHWVPHLTLAPRVPLDRLPLLVATTNDVLPLAVRLDRAALIDSTTGETWPLPHLP